VVITVFAIKSPEYGKQGVLPDFTAGAGTAKVRARYIMVPIGQPENLKMVRVTVEAFALPDDGRRVCSSCLNIERSEPRGFLTDLQFIQ
jgi:hypothetical protein